MSANETEKPKIIAISQARMGSSRLPGKVLMDLHGKPLLLRHCERVLEAKLIDKFFIATSKNAKDKKIEEFCKENDISCHRGSEKDVFSRYLDIAKSEKPDIIVRVTSDCPLISPELIDKLIDEFLLGREIFDYATLEVDHYPRGVDVEVFSYSALKRLGKMKLSPVEKEHVTIGFYKRPESFKCLNYRGADNLNEIIKARLCVDEQADFDFVSSVLKHLEEEKLTDNITNIVNLLIKKPKLLLLNNSVEQTKV